MKKFLFAPACVAMLVFAGCSQPAPKTAEKKEEVEKPQPVTGQSALWKMYQVARSWAPDAEVLKMNSIPLAEVEQVRGKAAAWQATFTSATKGKARTWTYSVIESEGNLHKGAFGGLEEPYSGGAGLTSPFPIAAVKIDTDAAFKTASEKATDYEKKNPGKPISFILEKTKKHPDPTWRVIWGESVSTSSFSVYIDASGGAYIETVH